MKQQVVAVVGPTAVGKTKLSVEIAKRFNGEVISGDSMQVYKGMDIGTAKVTETEKQGVPHYMIDIKEPDQHFSVAEFQLLVAGYIQKIGDKNKLPIIAGGTGLYIQAALFGYNFTEQKRDEQYQKALEEEINANGIEPVYERLKRADPEQAAKIHPNNMRRVIRALEVYETTGMTMTEYQNNQQTESDYDPYLIGLDMDRETLYKRINERVDTMMEQGLLEEVENLYQKGLKHAQAMKAIGYKEFLPFLEGEASLEDSIELLKRNSRRYAKRQLTWFKNKMDVEWYSISPDNPDEKFEVILNDLAGKIEKK
ncbi:tRNA (adenosine(37)-N6)-dimethylallyltransferase MiaA [Sediminibacillus massiliensis]|uniref:tRNA (adenosine(37)-N6)-dimethylallyltransferase MiaA n=1 Tax=Sediminibacillus massiliensis TaxID=1926277 RepID=UPI0009885FD6|nr:tRNA (adenosine(37)-N6)-dimethylallyltransferase MiaA [Sediminibacillus massiliensis]